MRKIGTEKKIEEKRKRNVLYISAFMLVVLVIGTIGFGFLSNTNIKDNDDNSQTNEGKVINQNGRWIANVNGQSLYFTNSPDSTKNISVFILSNINNFAGTQLYIDSNNTAVINEIGLTLGRFSGRFQEACYGGCEKDLPEKNCTENLIVWRDSLENKVYQEEKCIFIEGDLRAVDAFLYKIFELN